MNAPGVTARSMSPVAAARLAARFCAAIVVSVLAFAEPPPAGAEAEVPDEIAAVFVVPVKHATGAPSAVVLETKSNWWQLPSRNVRRGQGLAFQHTWKETPGATCRLWVEAEPLAGRKLLAATDAWIDALRATVDKDGAQLAVAGKRDAQPKKVSFGKTKLSAYRIRYRQTIAGGHEGTKSYPVDVIACELRDALVVVSYMTFTETPGDVTALVADWRVEPLAAATGQMRVKVHSAALLPTRFATALLPGGFVSNVTGADSTAAWERRDAAGQQTARIALDPEFLEPGFDVAKIVSARRAKFAQVYGDVSDAAQAVTTATGPGFRIDFTDRNADDGTVWYGTAILVPEGDMVWTWLLRTRREGPDLDRDRAEFQLGVATARHFRSVK